MDLLTHVLCGYLISYWASGTPLNIYIVFGTLAALVPDADVLLSPLVSRLPLAGHHGITHTVIFVILFSTLVYALLSLFMGISDPKLLLLMYLTGLAHILGDFIGTGSVNPLYPLKKRPSKLNLEVGASPVLAVYSLASLAFLAAINLNIIDTIDMWTASLVIAGAFVANLAVRVAMKLYFSRKAENRGFSAIPTIAPHRWRFARRTDTDREIAVEIKTALGIERYPISREERPGFKSCEDLVFTYWLSQVQSRLAIFDYPYYRIDCNGGSMKIVWMTVEMGEVMRVRVDILNGHPQVRADFDRSIANYLDDLKMPAGSDR